MDIPQATPRDLEIIRGPLMKSIPWITDSGLRLDFLEVGHVRLTVPAARHLNHLGIVYAGTHFMLMEVAGAILFWSLYGLDRFAPVNREMSIRYLRPAKSDISCELSLGPEEAASRIAPAVERGKGDWILDMAVTDTSGNVVSTSTCHYVAIPKPA